MKVGAGFFFDILLVNGELPSSEISIAQFLAGLELN